VLRGLQLFYMVRAEFPKARTLAEQLLSLAQRQHDPVLLVGAHSALGQTLYYLGEFSLALAHLEQGLALYDPQQQQYQAWAGGHPGIQCLGYAAWVLWYLGYPDQALKKSQEALTLAKELSHSVSLAAALYAAEVLHHCRREWQIVQELTEALMTLATEQGFAFRVSRGTIFRGRMLVEQGQVEEGAAQIRQGIAADQAIGAEVGRPLWLTLLAEAYGKVGQVDEGLNALAEGLTVAHKTGEGLHEAELYRLRGELTLQKLSVVSSQLSVPSTQHLTPSTQAEVEREAEEYFLKAIDIARKQQAKSLELRAATSLARLWQQQALEHGAGSTEQGGRSKELGVRSQEQGARTKLAEAHHMLSEVYNWFTEGFDTKDLQEAKTLLESLASRV
jgi:predicted ATPase